MSRNYDNWERLVGAVLRREKDRRLAYCESFSSSSSADLSSRFSFDGDVHESADLCSGNIFFSRDVKAMEYNEIKKATSNFRADNLLGAGPYSGNRVYKGWIDENYVAAVKPGSGIAVAVTVVDEWEDAGVAYWFEKKNNLSQYRHPNLVIPIGYYADTYRDKRIFVNEFIARGSLDRHLFIEKKPLPWATRMRVAVGAARGLAFLHNLEVPVLYGVLTSHDILLDADFNAKLSKIGIARDGSIPIDYSPDIKAPWAPPDTYRPYAARELLYADTLSTKCDVYSFGVVLMELITGRQAFDGRYPAGERYLMDWARPYLGSKRKFLWIMDTTLEGIYPHKEAYKVGQKEAYTVGQKEAFKVGRIVLQCVSSNPRSRPTMAEVVAALRQL